MSDYKLIGDGSVELGEKCTLGEGVTFIINSPSKIIINDYVTIGDNVKFVVDAGDVYIDDCSTLHSNILIMSTKGLYISEHCWFGQNTVLDGTGGLYIGRGVRVGMYSQVWTHVAAGEQIEGCTLYGESPVKINNDAWLVGSCTVSSGVTIGEKAICMNGSNITKNVMPNTVVMGTPAKERENLAFYKHLDLAEKFSLLEIWLRSFCEFNDCDLEINNDCISIVGSNDQAHFFKTISEYSKIVKESTVSYFCVENKKYIKSLNSLEGKLIKYLSGNKARFYK